MDHRAINARARQAVKEQRAATAHLDALVTLCATGDRTGRHRARRELLEALRADGYKLGKAKLLADVWTAERRRMLRAGPAQN